LHSVNRGAVPRILVAKMAQVVKLGMSRSGVE
jgi:hypothetical protein